MTHRTVVKAQMDLYPNSKNLQDFTLSSNFSRSICTSPRTTNQEGSVSISSWRRPNGCAFSEGHALWLWYLEWSITMTYSELFRLFSGQPWGTTNFKTKHDFRCLVYAVSTFVESRSPHNSISRHDNLRFNKVFSLLRGRSPGNRSASLKSILFLVDEQLRFALTSSAMAEDPFDVVIWHLPFRLSELRHG